MKDIARDLGVSLVTVSKALRHHPDISKKTRERVEVRVKELNYRPNLAARSLVTGRSSLIGFIVPDLIHPFFADVAKGLSFALREHGYFLIMSSSEEDPVLEQQEINHMLAHRLDAIVVASCAQDPTALRETQRGEAPLILVDRMFDGFPTHFVGSDDYASGKLATEHLITAGCKKIAHIRGPENSPGRRRLKGFLDTMAKHGLAVPPERVVRSGSVDVDGKRHGRAAFEALCKLKPMPDGIFVYNDVVAIGVIMAAHELGLRVPEDIAIIGCGNLHFDDTMRVPLSSIDQRSREIGIRTAKLILELKAQDTRHDDSVARETSFRRVVLQPRLVERASTFTPSLKRKSPAKKARVKAKAPAA